MHVGLFEESEAAFARALAISPDDLVVHQNLPFVRYHEGAHEEALALCEAALQRGGSSAWQSYVTSLCHLRLGDLDRASATIERSARLYPEEVLVHPVRGLIAASRGDHGEARRHARLTVDHEKRLGHYHHAQYDLACIYALLGDTEAALPWIHAASRNGYPCRPLFEGDAFLRSLRHDERFSRLLAELDTECARYRRTHAELETSTPA
jgi:tetratricopeptide (TPR) repeat protein